VPDIRIKIYASIDFFQNKWFYKNARSNIASKNSIQKHLARVKTRDRLLHFVKNRCIKL
jgi:hypothetical protein